MINEPPEENHKKGNKKDKQKIQKNPKTKEVTKN